MSNPFLEMCRDEVHVLKQDGRRLGPYQAKVQPTALRCYDTTLDVDEGDAIWRELPNGKTETYKVLEVTYNQGLHGIPPSHLLTIRKDASLVERGRVQNINIAHSQGFQVGDHNTQNIADAFKTIIERIDAADATPEEKADAKGRLALFLEHPLTSAVVGGAVSGLSALLKGG